MKTYTLALALLFAPIAIMTTPVLADEYDDAVAAYDADDYDTSLRLLRPLTDAGHAEAQYYLAVHYEFGYGVEQDYATALSWYKKSAAAGDRDAQYRIAQFYEKAKGVEEDPKTAFTYYMKAAEQGNWHAQHEVGLCYSSGYGVKKSKKKAAGWFQKAIDKRDYAPSQRELGVLYELGEGVKQNYQKAAELYAAAGDQGDADGRAFLAEMYESGTGVGEDRDYAIELYKQAAVQGSDYATNALKRMGVDNDFEGDKAYAAYLAGDYKEAIRIWEGRVARDPATAEEAESIVNSLYNLGMAYKDGTGVSKNNVKAREYFQRSALNDHPDAQVELGHIYYFGKGTAQNYIISSDWYHRAAEQGNADGQHNLAIMFEKGLGIPEDKPMAMLLYNMAAEQGHAGGKQALAHFAYMEEKAVRDEWFDHLAAAAQRFAEAAKAKQARCRRPIGTSSYLHRKFQETGYRWEWKKPYGC